MKAAAVTVMVTVLVAAAVINAQQGREAATHPPHRRAFFWPALAFLPLLLPLLDSSGEVEWLDRTDLRRYGTRPPRSAPFAGPAPPVGAWGHTLWGRQPVTKNSPRGVLAAPTLFKFVGAIDEPQDTWIDLREWGTGAVFVNGFNLGQYSYLGPDNALLWPAPLQRQGRNQVVVLELFKAPADFALSLFEEPTVG